METIRRLLAIRHVGCQRWYGGVERGVGVMVRATTFRSGHGFRVDIYPGRRWKLSIDLWPNLPAICIDRGCNEPPEPGESQCFAHGLPF